MQALETPGHTRGTPFCSSLDEGFHSLVEEGRLRGMYNGRWKLRFCGVDTNVLRNLDRVNLCGKPNILTARPGLMSFDKMERSFIHLACPKLIAVDLLLV